MFKVACVAALLAASFVSYAHADSFRPGASPAGGRIGVFCNSDLLSSVEQKDCIRRFKKAKSDDERRELVGTLQETFKERQKAADEANERLNPGGRNGQVCTGQQCQ